MVGTPPVGCLGEKVPAGGRNRWTRSTDTYPSFSAPAAST